jgi:hypothetical protein
MLLEAGSSRNLRALITSLVFDLANALCTCGSQMVYKVKLIKQRRKNEIYEGDRLVVPAQAWALLLRNE